MLVIVGVVGLESGLIVMFIGVMLVLVNKESFVMVGDFVYCIVVKYGVKILLVDSEYFVVF